MSDYQRIAEVIRYLDENREAQPSLDELADRLGLSSHHFHRLFSSWVGVTPKAFLQCLTFTDARARLLQGQSVLKAALQSGLSGPGRLHDLCVSLEAATPGEIKSGGEGCSIEWGVAASPLGPCLVAEAPRGVCHFSFLDSHAAEAASSSRTPPGANVDCQSDGSEMESLLRGHWPRAALSHNPQVAQRLVAKAFAGALDRCRAGRLRCWVRGTRFQLKVWRALIQIPPGQLVSYGGVAAAIGQPRASRAVGAAIGSNPIAMLIPCHRVIRQTGLVGEYRWGSDRKRVLIAAEAAVSDQPRVATGPLLRSAAAVH